MHKLRLCYHNSGIEPTCTAGMNAILGNREQCLAYVNPVQTKPKCSGSKIVGDDSCSNVTRLNSRTNEAWLVPMVAVDLLTLSGILSGHCAVKPPSTGRFTPVTHLASSLARNTAAPAISSGTPVPPNGWSASSCSLEIRFVVVSANIAVLVTGHVRDEHIGCAKLRTAWIDGIDVYAILSIVKGQASR